MKKTVFYSNVEDVVFCGDPNVSNKIMEIFMNEGHAVSRSTVQITTGTHGTVPMQRLDIYKKGECDG